MVSSSLYVCIPGFTQKPRGVYISARSLTEVTALNMVIFQPAMLVYQRVPDQNQQFQV